MLKQIKNLTVNLYKSVEFDVLLKDDNNMLIDIKRIVLQDEEYNNWATDDNYIIQKSIEKLNLQL